MRPLSISFGANFVMSNLYAKIINYWKSYFPIVHYAKEMNWSGYYEPLHKQAIESEHWKRLKKEVFAMFPLCACCNRRAQHLHHVTYVHIGRETIWDVVPVCAICHKYIHKNIKEHLTQN
jgi:aspartate ammonia-lyase